MQLTWLGAAGFKVDTTEGARFLIDPYLSRPHEATPPSPIRLTDLHPVDEIFLTNGRFDHASDTPALVAQTGAIIHASPSVCQRLAAKGVSNHSLESITLKKTKRVGHLTWQALPSRINQADSSPVLRSLIRSPITLPHIRALDREWPPGEVVAYLFQVDNFSMIHFGSAGWVETEISYLQPDVALLPVESASYPSTPLVALLRPKVVIPHHWDNYYPPLSEMIDLTKFELDLQMLAPGIRVYTPTIGQSFNPLELLR